MKFITARSTGNAKTAIKCILKKERLLAKQQRDLNAKKRNYRDDPERRQEFQKTYNDEKRIHKTV